MSDLPSQVDRMIDAFTAGLIASDEFERRVDSKRSQLDREAATFELKRNRLKLLVERIEICETEIRMVHKFPPNHYVPSPDNSEILQHWMAPC